SMPPSRGDVLKSERSVPPKEGPPRKLSARDARRRSGPAGKRKRGPERRRNSVLASLPRRRRARRRTPGSRRLLASKDKESKKWKSVVPERGPKSLDALPKHLQPMSGDHAMPLPPTTTSHHPLPLPLLEKPQDGDLVVKLLRLANFHHHQLPLSPPP